MSEYMRNAEVGGIRGVLKIESGKPGPILGVTASTHGNEPTGLAIIDHLLNTVEIGKNLLQGTLFLVLNNIEASRRYFDATTEEEVRKARYCDVNMNRLPDDVLERKDDSRYEIRRAQELYPIWKQFEYGLDVHSTLETSEPMIITMGDSIYPKLMRGFSIPMLLTGMGIHQLGKPACAFYGAHASSSVFGIEAGQHEEEETFTRAAVCATALLQNLGMLPGTPHQSLASYQEYQLSGSIIFPDISYDFVRVFEHKEYIQGGEILAESTKGLEPIRMPYNGHLIMPSIRRGIEKDVTEEASFLSKPVRTRLSE